MEKIIFPKDVLKLILEKLDQSKKIEMLEKTLSYHVMVLDETVKLTRCNNRINGKCHGYGFYVPNAYPRHFVHFVNCTNIGYCRMCGLSYCDKHLRLDVPYYPVCLSCYSTIHKTPPFG